MGNITDTDVTVTTVDKRGVFRDFINVPHLVYAEDPNWVAPLNFLEKQRFSPSNHFFEHARWQAWVAYRDGRPAGRITAQVDELHLQLHGDGVGFFGMLEAVDDPGVFDALFRVAEAWLREQGVSRIRGPLNLHVNEEIGLLVEGFDTPPYIMMGHGCPWYDGHLARLSLHKARDLLAYHVAPDFVAPRVMTRLADRVSERVTVRPLQRARLQVEAEVMRDIFNDAWARNWGFVPLEESEFAETVKTLTMLMPDEYIQIAEYDGEPVAFIVALPNINEASRDLKGRLLPFGWAKLLWRLKIRHPETARVPLMGVRQEYQHSRLGPTFAFMVIDAVRKALHQRGVRKVEMGWILEDNDGMRNIIESIGGVAYKRYRVYEKELN